jgi:hypothetical protein
MASAFKPNRRVSVTRGGTYIGEGRITAIDQRKNGAWYGVNFALPRKAPDVRWYRAGNLTLA